MRIAALAAGVLLLATVPARAQSLLYSVLGDAADSGMGASMASAGDVDADGVPDFVVGGNQLAGPNRGTVDVYSGRTGNLLYHWERNDWLGRSVAGAGDINNDGHDDILAGAYFSSYVAYSGKDGSILFQNSQTGTRVGWSVDGLGDVDGDGYDDYAVGAPLAVHRTQGQVGRLEVISGRTFTALHTFWGPGVGSHFGSSVANLGDSNNDGYVEVAVGAPDYSSGRNGGYVAIYSMRLGSLIDELTGSDSSAFGFDVAGGADVNHDTHPDLVVGAPGADLSGDDSGAVYVFSGIDHSLIHSWNGAVDDAAHGFSVACPGDVDGDSYGDVVVGAPYETGNSGGVDYQGTVWVYSGLTGLAFRTVRSIDDELLGYAVCEAGDVDQDGYADFGMTDPGWDVPFENAGGAWLFSGKPCQAWRQNYGTGLAGTLGIPTLESSADPILCTSVDLQISNSLGAPTGGVLFIGFAAGRQKVFGGTLVVAPPWQIVPLGIPVQGIALPVDLPCDTALCDLEVFFQVLESDPGAPRGLSFTRGLHWILGY